MEENIQDNNSTKILSLMRISVTHTINYYIDNYNLTKDEKDLTNMKRGKYMKKMGIGVGVLIFRDNKILLGLRNSDEKIADSDMHLEGTWTLPSGEVKFGETFEQAGIRKVKEECNLDIKKIKVICFQNDVNEFAHYATIGLVALEYSGEIEIIKTNELVRFDWFDIRNLPENLCFPSRKIINKYQNSIFYEEEN